MAGARHLRQEPSFSSSSSETFGPYRVLHQIGAGTLGPVFRAHDPASGRLVALKVFQLDLPPERAATLAVELSHLVERGLTHSAIAAPVGAGLQGATPYLASEYVAAESLDIAAKRHRSASYGDVPWIIRRIAEAIDYGAGQGAEHGLLHPRDVLVTDADARVTGLGVGGALERIGVRLPVRRPYSAPERVEGTHWTHAADVYALGVLAYELLVGRPFAGEAGVLTIRPEELPEIDVKAVGDVLARSLATEPDKRHRTAKAFVRDLDAALARPARKGASLPLLDSRSTPSETGSLSGSTPGTSLTLDEAPDDGSQPLRSVEEQSIEVDRTDEGSTPSVSQGGMFGTHGGSSGPPQRRRLGLIAVGVVLAAMVVAGYLAVSRSGWRTPPQPTSGTPWTETTVAPPAEPQVPAAAPSETRPPDTVPPGPNRPDTASAAPVTPPPARRERPAAAKATAALPTRNAPVMTTGRMLIRSTPAGAAVAVNGAGAGVTPLVLRNLPFGSYTIRLTHPGYAPTDQPVTLTAGREAQLLEVELREQASGASQGATSAAALGSLFVDSRPAGAIVYFNNQRMGQTPLVVADLQAGPGTVRLERDGYRPWSSTVQVTAGARGRVTASLERATTP